MRRNVYVSITGKRQYGTEHMHSDDIRPQDPLVVLTANIVAAYVKKHVVPAAGLGDLISGVHNALSGTRQTRPRTHKPGLQIGLILIH